LEHFWLGHVAAQEHKAVAFVCKYSTVTVQADPHLGTMRHQKCVFYELAISCCALFKDNERAGTTSPAANG